MDPSKRVNKEAIPTLESELLAAEESLNDISREIEFARKQELLLKEATGMRMRVNCCTVVHVIVLPSLIVSPHLTPTYQHHVNMMPTSPPASHRVYRIAHSVV